jgi:hypothetical protein
VKEGFEPRRLGDTEEVVSGKSVDGVSCEQAGVNRREKMTQVVLQKGVVDIE